MQSQSSSKALIRNKPFLVVLIIGILCLIVSLILFIVILTHLDSCITLNACSEQSSGYYNFCVEDGYKYCCGGTGSDHYSCGDYLNNCRKKGDGFIQCGPVFEAELAMNAIAFACFVLLVVIGCMHRRQTMDDQDRRLIQAQMMGNETGSRNEVMP